jgi:hypothetical protein
VRGRGGAGPRSSAACRARRSPAPGTAAPSPRRCALVELRLRLDTSGGAARKAGRARSRYRRVPSSLLTATAAGCQPSRRVTRASVAQLINVAACKLRADPRSRARRHRCMGSCCLMLYIVDFSSSSRRAGIIGGIILLDDVQAASPPRPNPQPIVVLVDRSLHSSSCRSPGDILKQRLLLSGL